MIQPLVVILGAGRPFSGKEPAPLQRISGDRRTLDWLIDSFNHALDNPEIHFVGGYRLDVILEEYPDIHFSRNEKWEETGTLGSLLSAPLAENRPIYVCYSDVVFQPDIIEKLAVSKTATVVDERWQTRYESRTNESRERAEKAMYATDSDGNTFVDRVSIEIDPRNADAEFTGLARLSPKALKLFHNFVDRDLLTPEDSITDLVTALSVGGIHPDPINIEGH
jgi:choline kinase